jgi:DNA modification methylase
VGNTRHLEPDTASGKTGETQDKFVMLAPTDLTPHPENPRKHSKSQIRGIAKSIQRNGYTAPIIADKDKRILAGHGRQEAALLLGLSTIPVIIRDDLTEEQGKAYMLADNKLTDRSTWDDLKVATILKELSLPNLELDLEATGFETPEIDFRIQSLDRADATDVADEFEIAAVPPTSMVGDVWRLGDHRIYCGTALDRASYSALFEGSQAAAVFTDPPYNVKINGNAAGHGKTSYREFAMAVGEMSDVEFTDFLITALSNASSNLVPGALIYACMDWRHIEEILAAARASTLDLLNLCVWVKANGRLGSFYKSRHELVFVFKSGKVAHQNNIQLGRFGRNRTNVWHYSTITTFGHNSTPADTELHPTVKPLLLVSDAILDSTKRNDIVLDPFLGSGTTLLAAERTGRRCFGIELDPIYVDTAISRWQRMTGHKALSPFGEAFDFLKTKRSGAP